MQIVKDEAEPTAVELLCEGIIELKEEVAELRHRLSGQHSEEWDAGRAQRWRETLATVTNAIDERVEHALQRQKEAA